MEPEPQQQLERLNALVDQREQAKRAEDFKRYSHLFKVVEDFVRRKRLLLYGGYAINASLPANQRFYDNIELPDYDMFSPNSFEDAKELADAFHALKYKYVEVKPGIHHGTFKVYVEFVPVADITDVPKRLFQRMTKVSTSERACVSTNNPQLSLPIAPLDFLRSAFHLELSRPQGDVSRWSKVYTRMKLFYKTYPLVNESRSRASLATASSSLKPSDLHQHAKAVSIAVSALDPSIPLGGLESLRIRLLAAGHTPAGVARLVADATAAGVAGLECVAEDPAHAAGQIAAALSIDDVVVSAHSPLNRSELLPAHHRVRVRNSRAPIAIVYHANACWGAAALAPTQRLMLSVDSQLCLWLAAQFADRPYLPRLAIRRLINVMLNMRQRDYSTSGQLPVLECYGHQTTLADLRRAKWHLTAAERKALVYRPGATSCLKERASECFLDSTRDNNNGTCRLYPQELSVRAPGSAVK
jgi:hypothetical protein